MTSLRSELSTTECTLSDGRTLAYATGGSPDGHPVVVHHGTPGSRLLAALCYKAAAKRGVRVIVPDRPGYGKSTAPPSGWTWHHWRDDLCELLEHESIDRAALVGFSGGGPFALAAATAERTTRVGLISSVVPPIENALSRLAPVPFALRLFFELSGPVARLRGPDAVVGQLTDRSLSDARATAVAAEFHEALRQGAGAIVRETRLFAADSFDVTVPDDVPLRAWHGTRDENAPLEPVERFVADADATVITDETDHLGTLLDYRIDALEWAAG
ncbi:alpha/beta fold hydrolase [Natrarchaeobius chitinivorans]|uniref:Alpha/beta hydrolase n=1 Tax=Natrarchaeobius chitinivorans TaxID=1679083 RepID=A0A3N6MPX1_NATCH|nr:alpha/beta hydrolase [Natrarchaeobius chitinivorans]RQG96596.1 alpha/beta hydrolase [Natrarchaeobius chitinivorans]